MMRRLEKKFFMSAIVIITIAFLAPQICRSQETTYLSSLGQTPYGAEGIGSNLWLGVTFRTGTNTGGYSLDAFQLSMANEESAGGRPGGFTVYLYSDASGGLFPVPGNRIATLGGSADPATAGIYTYTPASSLTLSPASFYSVVITASTPYIGPQAAPMGYLWNFMYLPNSSAYDPIGGWHDLSVDVSNDGVNWTSSPRDTFLYSIMAEPVPEPGTLSLSLVAGFLFVLNRLKQALMSGIFLFRIFVSKKAIRKQ
jgi:hypothetical protein